MAAETPVLYNVETWVEENQKYFLPPVCNKMMHNTQLKVSLVFFDYWHTVQATSVLKKASVWYEMRVLWWKLNHVKSHAMSLAVSLQTDMSQIF